MTRECRGGREGYGFASYPYLLHTLECDECLMCLLFSWPSRISC